MRPDAVAILEAAPDAILVVNRGERVLLANAAAQELFATGGRSLVGMELCGLLPVWARPSHGAEVEGFFRRPRARSFGTDIQLVARRLDGTEIPVDIALTHTHIGDQPMVIAAVRDRSRQAAAERARQIAEADARASREQLRAILAHVPAYVMLVGRDRTIQFANRGRRVSPSEYVGRPWDWAVPEQERPQLERCLVGALERGEVSECVASMPDGSGNVEHYAIHVGPLWGFTDPIHGGAPEILGAVAVAQDMTEQRRLQSELDASRRLATIGTLAAAVAHEINNPLSSVIANLMLAETDVQELTTKGVQATELVAELADAREGAERIRRIAQDLKRLARPSDEGMGPVDAQSVFESMLRLANNEIRHRARVVRDYQRVPAVRAAEGRLGQVLLNLLLNAAQAIPEGQARQHEIRVTTSPGPEGMVCVAVADNGPGMPEDVKARLFTPFFTTKTGTGTGLGLVVCDQIVRSFGGRIEVESQVGSGTTFRVLLPAAHAAPTPATLEAPPPSASSLRRGRVLVVDDEPAIAMAMRRTLLRAHDVAVAAGATEALAILEQGQRFDVIFCDVMMPVMTGPELIEILRERFPDQVAGVVLTTGGAFTPRARELLERVQHRLIEKPFDPQQLRGVVAERLRACA